MLYYLALWLMPHFGAMNLFTYHTVRAGGAALTGFVLCLAMGPWLIRMLRALKIGQYIKKEHVADLHELHKGKAGTPTMGGTMILLATGIALLLWGRLDNRLLLSALLVFLVLGVLGFIDDYVKLKRKHNDGISARAKIAGQIVVGLVLGVYLVNNPITVSAAYVYPRDVTNWRTLEWSLISAGRAGEATAAGRIWERFPEEQRGVLLEAERRGRVAQRDKEAVLKGLRAVLTQPDLYVAELWPEAALNQELTRLLQHGVENLGEREVVRLNRLLLEAALPNAIAPSLPDMHTKVGIPGFKNLLIPMGGLYAVFVMLIIVSMSNAVNLTDGLDGLAAGVSVISILAYAGIAYVVSRVDWSQYLYLTYVPEASELFVFGGALLGTGLGFLWYNSHPADVFMGDTGSLALGGAIATMAILTKQELILPVVAGLFVLEALSVVIQVASYKTTGKRVFRMAPLHHHFELLGWSETKVTMRFYIIALLFALMSLGTLKLR